MLQHQNIIHKDTIFINDLTVNTTIGQEPWEIAVKQPIIINISISTNFLNTNNKNMESPTINHQLIINIIIDFCHTNTFNLLECLVTSLEQLIVDQFPKNILALQISAKRQFPTSNVKEIGVNIDRTYNTRKEP